MNGVAAFCIIQRLFWKETTDANRSAEDRALSLHDELAAFYERNGFGPVLGARPRTVPVFTGCLLVPLPNIETRRRYLKYHDLHHLLTGYTTGRIGEGEVSAWELGTGSFLHCLGS